MTGIAADLIAGSAGVLAGLALDCAATRATRRVMRRAGDAFWPPGWCVLLAVIAAPSALFIAAIGAASQPGAAFAGGVLVQAVTFAAARHSGSRLGRHR